MDATNGTSMIFTPWQNSDVTALQQVWTCHNNSDPANLCCLVRTACISSQFSPCQWSEGRSSRQVSLCRCKLSSLHPGDSLCLLESSLRHCQLHNTPSQSTASPYLSSSPVFHRLSTLAVLLWQRAAECMTEKSGNSLCAQECPDESLAQPPQ